MTQAERLLGLLKEGPVCSYAMYDPESGVTHRLAARIHDLRRSGWLIDTRPCGHSGHVSPAVEYVLVSELVLF